MEYIHQLRSKVGHDRILIPATAIVILNTQREVLLHLRNESNEWGLPGGLMDVGETALESAIREVREETGLQVQKLQLFGVFSGPKFEVTYPNNDRTAPVILGFFTQQYQGALTISAESPELGFYALSRLPQNMNQFHQSFIEGFKAFQGQELPVPICF